MLRNVQINPASHRLNLLLSSSASWHADPCVDQLPRLLEPLGIRSIVVGSGEEAADVIRSYPVHIAVVDLSIPLCRMMDSQAAGWAGDGGPRILELLRRLEQPPPTVVVRPPQPTTRESTRTLTDALRQGAFAVLDRPLHLERMLEVMRRILHRYYEGMWPD